MTACKSNVVYGDGLTNKAMTMTGGETSRQWSINNYVEANSLFKWVA